MKDFIKKLKLICWKCGKELTEKDSSTSYCRECIKFVQETTLYD